MYKKIMKVWIINPYGNIPGEGWREYRSTLIAEAFAKKGHNVVWWVSNFEHRSKKYRSDSWEDIQINVNFLVKLVPTTPYSSHISFDRIKHERNYARSIKEKVLSSNNKPDLIILGEPALFWSDIILKLIKKLDVPFVIDILDLWPELFNILLPKKLSFFGKIIFAPLYWKRSRLIKKANGIIGATIDYLEVGAKINKKAYTDVVYLGIDLIRKGEKEMLNIKNVDHKKKNECWIIYAGTLGNNYDIKTIIKCAKEIERKNYPLKIFIAGDGALKELLLSAIKKDNLQNLCYLGKLNVEDLNLFYQQCDIGLSSYVKKSTVSMPVKAFDYFSAGLPLVNSLDKELGRIVVEFNVGLQYEAENHLDMLRVMLKLAGNKELLNSMRKNTIELAKKYDKNIQYHKFVTLSEKILKNNTKSVRKSSL